MTSTAMGSGGDTWTWWEGFGPDHVTDVFGPGVFVCARCHGGDRRLAHRKGALNPCFDIPTEPRAANYFTGQGARREVPRRELTHEQRCPVEKNQARPRGANIETGS